MNIRLLLLIFPILLLGSCKKKIETCEELINFAKDNKGNLGKLNDFKKAARNFKDTDCLPKSLFDENGAFNHEAFQAYFKKPENYDVEVVETPAIDEINVNFYLENSASMWGYFKGQTECEAAVGEMIVDAGFLFNEKKINFAYITTEDSVIIQKPKKGFTEFLMRLEPEALKRGKYWETKLADIFKTVINNTGSNEISILISDCIYSLNGEDKADYQALEWVLIKQAFLNVLNNSDFSILVNKYTSSFEGGYYCDSLVLRKGEMKEMKINLSNVKRPYYVFVLGNREVIQTALQKINFRTYAGFKDDYFISKEKPLSEIDYRILMTDRIGKFRIDRKNPQHGIEGAKKANRGDVENIFGFSVGLDNSSLILDDNYITDAKNYEISGDYELEVVKFDKVGEDGFTHKLLLKTSNLKSEELNISLRRQTPSWISETNSNNDCDQSGAELDKTYGFEPFINGVEKAFDTALKKQDGSKGTDNFYTLRINIKN